jgi:hypothetical protein
MPTPTTSTTKLRFGSAVPHSALRFAAVLGLLLATATGAVAGADSDSQLGGAFTCDFGLSSDPSLLPLDQIAPSTERDRMYMSARPGMLHKHIPISFDDTGIFFPVDGICLTRGSTLGSTGIGSSTTTCSTAYCFSNGPTSSAPSAMPGARFRRRAQLANRAED